MSPTPIPEPLPQTLAHILAALQATGLERLDAQLLLLHVLGQPPHQRGWLLAHDTDTLPPALGNALTLLAQRRLAGEPLAYLTGRKEFFGLDLAVDARVLVPRPDTETLVSWGIEILTDPNCTMATTSASGQGKANRSALDLGTGSGAIALALKASLPALQVHAIDFSADALAVAQANAQRLQLAVTFSQGAWFAGLADPSVKYDCIVSNPPYIAALDPHLAALTHEPLQALASGADGLDDIRQIITQAPAHLKPGGWLLLEHGYDQAQTVRDLLTTAGFTQVQSRCDLAGIERCSGGQHNATPADINCPRP
ncbi:MAG: peptide chain release factor N(5)-glutamine methyltransferase [Rhodoferax sp.]|uniref:peptide chain release factor N(5)-glutamine methyltransferase n=1 Tax=Rhodoferax sp. TaxID=50421 RepID=UPI0026212BF0|nr:peptide chain release factor N(5)-glutamine methyltransferase [Rhodoferax sp.]MDD2880404.1 peptide chain release factor N(5)-glutamine methyltransferase [Rhodoferax sp.]